MKKPVSTTCHCKKSRHACKRIVITGGPGAGKTAVLEMIRHTLCHHVEIVPESASIIFKGGFWRKPSLASRMAAQRAIYHVQRELEQTVLDEHFAFIALCDRGTLDGLAYWPGSAASFFKQIHSSKKTELEKYHAVIHLRTPTALTGYNNSNPIRIEDAKEASNLDRKIEAAWRGHPHRHFVESTTDFLEKARTAIDIIEREIPACCIRSSWITH